MTQPLPRSPRREDGSVLAVVILVLVAAAALFVVASWVAVSKSKMVRERWAESFGTREELLQRYPAITANATAIELERLSGALGIDTVPRHVGRRGDPERSRPADADRAEHQAVKAELNPWLNAELERPDRRLAPPPAAVVEFLARHEEQLDAVRSHLLAPGEPPRWERDMEKLFAAPLPNLLGHIDLHKLLLTDALVRAREGDRDGALAAVHASWRLNLALVDEPVLIEQLIAVAVARLQAGVLRQIPDVPGEWRARLFEHDFRESFVEALRFEGWVLAQSDNPHDVVGYDRMLQRVLHTVGRPYYAYCVADISDKLRRRLDNLAGVAVLCDADLGALDADLSIPIPRWNVLDQHTVANMMGAVDRLRRLELDLELTGKLLELEAARRAGDGVPPQPPAGIEASAVCPDDRWLHATAPDGSMTIAFSREISWPNQMGAILPTSFTLRQ